MIDFEPKAKKSFEQLEHDGRQSGLIVMEERYGSLNGGVVDGKWWYHNQHRAAHIAGVAAGVAQTLELPPEDQAKISIAAGWRDVVQTQYPLHDKTMSAREAGEWLASQKMNFPLLVNDDFIQETQELILTSAHETKDGQNVWLYQGETTTNQKVLRDAVMSMYSEKLGPTYAIFGFLEQYAHQTKTAFPRVFWSLRVSDALRRLPRHDMAMFLTEQANLCREGTGFTYELPETSRILASPKNRYNGAILLDFLSQQLQQNRGLSTPDVLARATDQAGLTRPGSFRRTKSTITIASL